MLFLPEDVVFGILLWLPVVTLLRFKSVCQSWKKLIESSAFIDCHRLHNLYHHCDTLLHVNSHCNFHQLEGKDFQVSKPIDGPATSFQSVDRLIALLACNGLVCVVVKSARRNRVSCIHLWNPATKQSRVLPRMNIRANNCLFGFGWDEMKKDYKVVVSKINRSNQSSSRVEVYSSIGDSWSTKRINLSGDVNNNRAVYHNGSCFWVLTKEQGENLGETAVPWVGVHFDFNEEEFQKFPLPKSESLPRLFVWGGDIACVTSKDYGIYEMWIPSDDIAFLLNQSDDIVSECWLRHFTLPWYGVRLINILNNGQEYLLLQTNQGLCVYNTGTGEVNNIIEEEENERHHLDIVTYRESLVPVIHQSI